MMTTTLMAVMMTTTMITTMTRIMRQRVNTYLMTKITSLSQ